MDPYALLIYAHILLFVFWLGGDMGVLLNSIKVKDSSLSFETRATLLKTALTLDMLPRTCWVLMLPVGAYLASYNGLIPMDTAFEHIGTWAITVFWMTLTWAVPMTEGKPINMTLRKINMAFLLIMGAVFLFLSISSISNSAPDEPLWFAVKLGVFGLIFICGIMIDIAIAPMIGPFMELETEGSTPEREKIISGAMNHTIFWVLSLYACIAIIGWLGTTKPF